MSDDARPPYVRFEMRSVEDREATLAEGHYVAKDVVFAFVTPAGTKDILEKEADAWIAGLDEAARAERIPSNWPRLYREALEQWKLNRTDPEFGTPVNSWPPLSPAQLTNVLAANIRTVEDLAEATEEALARIGMGAQALKSKARAWLDSSKDTGKTAAELDTLRVESAQQKETIAELQEKVKSLETALAAKVKEKA